MTRPGSSRRGVDWPRMLSIQRVASATSALLGAGSPAGGILPAVPADLFGFFQDSHPAAGYALRTLDAHQNDTVVAMIDQIIPATETPGAKGARVNEFMDVILTEWANDKERRSFLSGSERYSPSTLYLALPGTAVCIAWTTVFFLPNDSSSHEL